MNTFKKIASAFVILSIVLISCNDTKQTQEETSGTAKEEIQAAIDTVSMAEVPVMIDTTGLHKLNNDDAKAYIIGMDRIISNLNKAIDTDDAEKKAALSDELRTLQRTQIGIQSALNKADRALFETYTQQIINRMGAVLTRIKPV